MPTPSEQKALAFVAIVILLGGAVRVLRAGSAPAPTIAEQQALARQATAADSAAATKRKSTSRSAKPRRVSIDTTPTVVAGVTSVPPQYARPDRPFAHTQSPANSQPVDLDVATEAQIEALPRIGPSLAKRIVANRDSLGAFGSLDALARVKGIGVATRKLLQPLVTFSGRATPR